MKNTKLIYGILITFFTIANLFAQAPTEAQKKAMVEAMKTRQNKVDPSTIPAKYAFTWKYNMEMTAQSGKTINFQYFLQPNATYYGAKMNQRGSDMLMVMDTKNKTMVTGFNQKGKKMAMVSKIPDYKDQKTKQEKYTFKKLPNKVILGYNCKGIQATSTSSSMVFYYTTEAKVSFAELFKSQQNQGIPNVFNEVFKAGEKPLLLSMDYTHLKDKSKSVKMQCTALNKEAFTFNKSDYQFM
ncbi:DUF4412 domain-containing protein [Flavobacterium amniphilum]|uniref:DUF4412 domain-containing protein n=1 Tax=Flavobacterium amniphilum TaxID=1834035 RepID=UPI002029D3D6|nr:DUF4412 domain-containing protein [Flavobacterium amniphilum]MCL9804870.1 DUF4412 domain-containing protein [Flavobacterium amniphilum]